MEIRVLRYFLAVAREGTVTGAANSLFVTQPTLSRQIQDLEDELGQKLFIRKSHRMELTKEGMIFYKRAEEILDLVDKTESEFKQMKEEVRGKVYIGSGESSGAKFLAKVQRELLKTNPGISFHMYSGNVDDISEKLDKGLLDFGLLIEPADLSKYSYITLSEKDRRGVVIPRKDKLADKPYLSKEDLLDLPLICSRQVINRELADRNFEGIFGDDLDKLNIVATYNLAYNANIMVSEGLGYAITIDGVIDTSGNSKLCFRPISPGLESLVSLARKKGQVFSPPADLFLKKMREVLEDET